MKRILSLAIIAMMMTIAEKGAWAQAVGPFPTALTNGTYGPAGSVTPNSNTNEYEVYNAINQLLNTAYTNNAQVDSLEFTGSTSTWQETGSGDYSVIGLGAGNKNTLEVYNAATPNVLINPFGTSFSGDAATGNGTSSSPYAGVASTIPAGDRFGFNLKTVGVANKGGSVLTGPGGNNWNSNPVLNSDGMEHMITYDLSSLTGKQLYIKAPGSSTEELITLSDPYLIAFEDLPLNNNGANSDMDYNDLMVLVNGAAPDAPAGAAVVPEPKTLALFGFGLIGMTGFGLAYRKFIC